MLTHTAQTALYQWLKHRERLLLELPPGADREAVWINPTGRYRGKRITAGGIYKLVRTIGEKAEIEEERVWAGKKIKVSTSPHRAGRHTFFTEAARAGWTLKQVMDQGGWAKADTCMGYLRVANQDRERAAALMPDFLSKSSQGGEAQGSAEALSKRSGDI